MTGMDAAALLSAAEQVATRAHEGQFDKAGRAYIHHPLRVAGRSWR
jgi:(p)ppGpp synthase/HD superfamily hydrolase